MEDDSGRVVYANEAFFCLFGLEDRSLGQLRLAELLAPGQQQVLAERRGAPGDPREATFELVALGRDGPLQLEVSTVRVVEDGAAVGVQSVLRDVGSRKRAERASRDTQETLRTLVGSLPVAVITLDRDAAVTTWSPAAEEMFGWRAAEVIGKTYPLLPEGAGEATRERLAEAVRSGRVFQGEEGKRLRADGRLVEVAIWSNPLRDEDGNVLGNLGVLADIGDRKRTERALVRQGSSLEQLFSRSPLAIVEIDPDDRVVDANGSFEELFGFSVAEARGRSLDGLVTAERPELGVLHEDARRRGRREQVCTRKDGSRVDVQVVSCPIGAPGERLGAYVVYEDISVRKAAEARLQHDASHDPLTGLANRAFFLDGLKRAIADERFGTGARFAVLFVDLDRFKIVNDSLGPAVGDRTLVATARRLVDLAGEGTLVARLGSDEFGLLVGTPSAEEAVALAERLVGALEVPLRFEAQEVLAGGTIGVAPCDPTFERAEHYLRNANLALHRARATGRPFAVFSHAMHAASEARLRVEVDLRRALAEGQLALHYQPIVNLATGDISGVEALMRWNHPERGMVSPAEFIPVAEETRLIVPMTRWALREAARCIRDLERDFPDRRLSVGVNISTVEFSQPSFLEDIRAFLQETGVRPGALAFEITESAMMQDAGAAVRALTELRAIGIGIYLDDFGTGYSSLAYLRSFPVDRLKVDRSFVEAMDIEADRAGIAGSIVGLAHDLGQDVVAEGVETAAQLAFLQRLGCEFAQGYHLAKPLEEAALRMLLASGRLLCAPSRIASGADLSVRRRERRR